MTIKLTDQQREAIANQPGAFIRVEDERSQKTYLMIEQSRANELYEQWLRDEIQRGVEAAERGDVADWNLEEFLSEMQRQHPSLIGES